MDVLYKFERTMYEQGIEIRERILCDGELHRFHVYGDKPGSKNGWYVLYLHPFPVGLFGSWKIGSSHKWIDSNPIALQNPSIVKKMINDLKQKRQDELEFIQRKVADKCRKLWESLIDAPISHEYLIRKGIDNQGARINGNALVLPVVDFQNNIHSLQYILPDGSKFFSKHGKKAGNFINVNYNPNSKILLIAEGYATAKTISKFYPNHSVIAALDSGNLPTIAKLCLIHRPNHKIIIFGDDDTSGKTKAHEAALICGAQVFFPEWPPDCPPNLTDFNDLYLFNLNKDVL